MLLTETYLKKRGPTGDGPALRRDVERKPQPQSFLPALGRAYDLICQELGPASPGVVGRHGIDGDVHGAGRHLQHHETRPMPPWMPPPSRICTSGVGYAGGNLAATVAEALAAGGHGRQRLPGGGSTRRGWPAAHLRRTGPSALSAGISKPAWKLPKYNDVMAVPELYTVPALSSRSTRSNCGASRWRCSWYPAATCGRRPSAART